MIGTENDFPVTVTHTDMGYDVYKCTYTVTQTGEQNEIFSFTINQYSYTYTIIIIMTTKITIYIAHSYQGLAK